MITRTLTIAMAAALSAPLALCGQDHVHTPGMQHSAAAHAGQQGQAATPTQAGQDAYGALAEVVRILEADPATDWSKVNLEALRQHLVDMHEVTLRARVAQTAVPGGARMDVTGEGRTLDAIRRMLRAHAGQLENAPEYRARVEEIADGARLVVTAERAGDTRTEAKIRGLGFIGLLTHGNHHAPHHLAMARGGAAGHAH